jgi:hypothetical protein
VSRRDAVQVPLRRAATTEPWLLIDDAEVLSQQQEELVFLRGVCIFCILWDVSTNLDSLERSGKDSLTIDLFDGDPSCRFCGMETETVQHLVCCCEALSRQRHNVFGELIMEPKDLCTATIRDLCLFIRNTGLSKLGWLENFRVAH